MYLRGQDGQRGYAMAALLVALGVMAVLMAAAMPVWRHDAQREREIETIFRGQQIARAIAMYREKNAGAFPSSLDILVQQRFLRKKYKDLLTEGGEWVPIGGGAQTQAQPGVGRGGQPQPGQQQPGQSGIMGVTVKDKGTAIVEYKRATHHNEYQFLFGDARTRRGASQGAGPGAGAPGQPGRGNRPGGPGTGFPGGPGMGGPGGRGGGRGPGAGRGPGMGPGSGRQGTPGGLGTGRRGGGD